MPKKRCTNCNIYPQQIGDLCDDCWQEMEVIEDEEIDGDI